MAERGWVPRPALHGMAVPGRHGVKSGAPGVYLTERTGLALASVVVRKNRLAELASAVRAAHGIELPGRPARVAVGNVAFVGTGPGQWLAAAEADTAVSFVADLARRLADLAQVADQSDGRAVVRVSGPAARAALAKGMMVDLDARAFAPGSAATTQVAYIGCQLWQLDAAPTYELSVFRGFAGSFWSWLMASAAEFGCEVTAPLP